MCLISWIKISGSVLFVIYVILRRLGGRSVLFAGSGEPLLHPDFCDIVNETKYMGACTAVSTNGALFTRDKLEECLKSLSWIRYSTSAGTEATYKKIHRGRDGDFARVISSIAAASEIKHRDNLSVVLNVQIIMIPENRHEVVTLAKIVKEAGADRFIVKSVGAMDKTQSEVGRDLTADFYSSALDIKEGLKALNDDKFVTVYRDTRVANTFRKKSYSECYAEPFHTMICADGGVCPCCDLQGREEFYFGNINSQSFSEIWTGERRKQVMEMIKASGMAPCPGACKLDPMNQYLDELLHPGEHVDFI